MVSWAVATVTLMSVTGVSLLMLRKLLHKRVIICNCTSPENKNAVITGATSGLGEATAFALAKRKWNLFIGCRDLDRGKLLKQRLINETGNQNIVLQHLELENLHSVKSFVSSITPDKEIHLLINNAGIMASEPRNNKLLDNIDHNMTVNFLSHFLLTKLLEPNFKLAMIKDKSYSRIVNVSSALAKRGILHNIDKILSLNQAKLDEWKPSQAYANSKLALSLFSRELDKRWGNGANEKLVDVFCVITGGMVNTNLDRYVMATLVSPLRSVMNMLKRALLLTPLEGCQSIVHCAISSDVANAHENDKGRDKSGSGLLYAHCVPIKWPPSAEDMDMAAKVWNHAEHIVSLIDKDSN